MSIKIIANVIARTIPNLIAFTVAFAFFVFLAMSQPVQALEYQGRVNTRYQLQIGDNAMDNDVFQYPKDDGTSLWS